MTTQKPTTRSSWFVKSLRSRAETLLKVGTCIVEEQIDFFEKCRDETNGAY